LFFFKERKTKKCERQEAYFSSREQALRNFIAVACCAPLLVKKKMPG
jgi:hypothetical protein